MTPVPPGNFNVGFKIGVEMFNTSIGIQQRESGKFRQLKAIDEKQCRFQTAIGQEHVAIQLR